MSLRKRERAHSKQGRPGKALSLLLAAGFTAALCGPVTSIGAQDAPALKTRTHGSAGAPADDSEQKATVATGHTDLPPEAQGDYPWDKAGSMIDLYFESGQLHGYMTDHIDPDPNTAPVVFDFATTHIDGHLVEWTTRVVHSTSYTFTGHLERGLVQTPAEPGYYLLTGTLTQHGGDADGLTRTLRLKREPGDG